MRLPSRWVAVAAAVAAVSSAALVSAEPRIDPQATEVFKKMSDYLGRTKALSARATFRQEVVLLTGQKVEYESWSQVTLRRPDRLRTSRRKERC